MISLDSVSEEAESGGYFDVLCTLNNSFVMAGIYTPAIFEGSASIGYQVGASVDPAEVNLMVRFGGF